MLLDSVVHLTGAPEDFLYLVTKGQSTISCYVNMTSLLMVSLQLSEATHCHPLVEKTPASQPFNPHWIN